MTRVTEDQLRFLGATQANAHYFDTLRVGVPGGIEAVRRRAEAAGINFRYVDDTTIGIALNETVMTSDVQDIVDVFAEAAGQPAPQIEWVRGARVLLDPPVVLRRATPFMTHPVFNAHRSETQMMRYIRSLERKDIGLDTSMIPLGLLHDEAERREPDAAGDVGALLAHPSVRAAGPDAGLRADRQRARTRARGDHRVQRGFAATELRCTG